MRHCFHHTDLGQNSVFHNFAIQIALVQYSGRSKHAWAFSYKPVKKIFQNHLYGQPVLPFAERDVVECLKLRSNVIKNLSWLFFYLMVLSMCNLV